MDASAGKKKKFKRKFFAGSIIILLFIYCVYSFITRPLPAAHITDEMRVAQILGEIKWSQDKGLFKKYKKYTFTVPVNLSRQRAYPEGSPCIDPPKGIKCRPLADLPRMKNGHVALFGGAGIVTTWFFDGELLFHSVSLSMSPETYIRFCQALSNADSGFFYTRVTASAVYWSFNPKDPWNSFHLDLTEDNQFISEQPTEMLLNTMWVTWMKERLIALASTINHLGGYDFPKESFEMIAEGRKPKTVCYDLEFTIKSFNTREPYYRVYATSPKSKVRVSYTSKDLNYEGSGRLARLQHYDIEVKE